MSNNTSKWKSRFLSSSIPLEFETAKKLAKVSSNVSYDYSYLRKVGNEHKEFSIDIKSLNFLNIRSEKRPVSTLTFLVECKYRDEGKKWVFLPDVNSPDLSSFTIGSTIKELAEFSAEPFRGNIFSQFEEKFEFSLKGVEINTNNGEVFDKDIKHGISQLKYGLPYLLLNSIEHNLFCHIDDAGHNFIIPILVTNADLFLLENAFSITALKTTQALERLGKKVPYLIFFYDNGPEFKTHHKEVFSAFSDSYVKSNNLKEIEKRQRRKLKKDKFYRSPKEVCVDLEESDSWTLERYYSQFFICNFDHFEELTKNLVQAVRQSIK